MRLFHKTKFTNSEKLSIVNEVKNYISIKAFERINFARDKILHYQNELEKTFDEKEKRVIVFVIEKYKEYENDLMKKRNYFQHNSENYEENLIKDPSPVAKRICSQYEDGGMHMFNYYLSEILMKINQK